VDRGAANRSNESRNVLVSGKLAEGEHTSRVGRLVIFDDELNWSAEHATGFVYLFSSELWPSVWWRPDSARGPVSEATTPILSGSAARPKQVSMLNIPAKTILQLIIR
jgi:hypothetical protein